MSPHSASASRSDFEDKDVIETHDDAIDSPKSPTSGEVESDGFKDGGITKKRASQASRPQPMTMSKARAIALVATVTGANFLNVCTRCPISATLEIVSSAADRPFSRHSPSRPSSLFCPP